VAFDLEPRQNTEVKILHDFTGDPKITIANCASALFATGSRPGSLDQGVE
jgi:hypothetical protein